jgi:uncharacterized protein
VVGTLVNTPPTFAPVYYAAFKTGSWVLGEENTPPPALLTEGPAATPAPADRAPWWQRWRAVLADVGKPLLVGTVIFSVVFSLLAYGLVSGVWHWRVRAKRRRRQRRLCAGAG